MIMPDRFEDLEARVIWLIARCKETQRDRVQVYDRRERYFLWGTSGSENLVRYNRIESHIDLVSSFLYAPDHAIYQIAAQRNANDTLIAQATALQDEFNDDMSDWASTTCSPTPCRGRSPTTQCTSSKAGTMWQARRSA